MYLKSWILWDSPVTLARYRKNIRKCGKYYLANFLFKIGINDILALTSNPVFKTYGILLPFFLVVVVVCWLV